MIDAKRRELRCGGELLEVEPQVFDLLVYLVQNRTRVVSKDDLLQAVWGGRIVSDSALATRINAARRALGDSGEAQRLIRTLPRKGFRFVAEIKEAPNDSGSALAAAPGAAGLGAGQMLPDTPAIAVLPLANIGVDAERESLAEGMVEEIITALSRIGWLPVVARRSSVPYWGPVVDAKRVGRELGVRYILGGAVRKSGNRVRITAQLIDAETAAYLWADRFDGALGEIFDLQEEAARRIAGAIEPIVEALEMHRSAGRPANDLTPNDLYRCALPGCYSFDSRSLLRAHDLLEQAIERDPGFGPALAAAAGLRQFLGVTGWLDDLETNRRTAVDLAHRALQADGNDPGALAEAARVLAYFTEDIDCAIAMIERSVALNPGHARGWFWNGWIRMLAGRPDLAIEHLQTASRLNPRYRIHTQVGMAHFFGRRYREATDALIASLHERPGWPTTLRFLAASYAHLGELKRARETASQLRAVTPAPAAPLSDCLGHSPYRNREQSALYAEGLRLANAAA